MTLPRDTTAAGSESPDLLDLKARLSRGDVPVAKTPDPLPGGDVCHFACAVRFGRRRADQFGHLVLSKQWLNFRGALDMSVSWSEVSSVAREGREIIAALQDSRRMLRFLCPSEEEAARGVLIAEHLARVGREKQRAREAGYQASV